MLISKKHVGFDIVQKVDKRCNNMAKILSNYIIDPGKVREMADADQRWRAPCIDEKKRERKKREKGRRKREEDVTSPAGSREQLPVPT